MGKVFSLSFSYNLIVEEDYFICLTAEFCCLHASGTVYTFLWLPYFCSLMVRCRNFTRLRCKPFGRSVPAVQCGGMAPCFCDVSSCWYPMPESINSLGDANR